MLKAKLKGEGRGKPVGDVNWHTRSKEVRLARTQLRDHHREGGEGCADEAGGYHANLHIEETE